MDGGLPPPELDRCPVEPGSGVVDDGPPTDDDDPPKYICCGGGGPVGTIVPADERWLTVAFSVDQGNVLAPSGVESLVSQGLHGAAAIGPLVAYGDE